MTKGARVLGQASSGEHKFGKGEPERLSMQSNTLFISKGLLPNDLSISNNTHHAYYDRSADLERRTRTFNTNAAVKKFHFAKCHR